MHNVFAWGHALNHLLHWISFSYSRHFYKRSSLEFAGNVITCHYDICFHESVCSWAQCSRASAREFYFSFCRYFRFFLFFFDLHACEFINIIPPTLHPVFPISNIPDSKANNIPSRVPIKMCEWFFDCYARLSSHFPLLWIESIFKFQKITTFHWIESTFQHSTESIDR